MEAVAISLGSIILLAIIFYFVIRSAVRDGINESMLFPQEQKTTFGLKEWEKAYKSIGKEVPDHIKKLYPDDSDTNDG